MTRLTDTDLADLALFCGWHRVAYTTLGWLAYKRKPWSIVRKVPDEKLELWIKERR